MFSSSDSRKDTIGTPSLSKIRRNWTNDVSVTVCGYQSGKARYLNRDERHQPYLLQWRNNLTALSQRYNLYMVAYDDALHVSRVTFPDQAVQSSLDASNSMLSIRLARSKVGMRGYMPGTNAHAINHLILAAMRDKEIVCVACDDGDVEAFYTKDIERHMIRAEAASHEGSLGGLKVYDLSHLICSLPMERDHQKVAILQPFFHFNVGASAWGLTVQAEHALLAVSTNAHKIFVFAFATATSELETAEEYQHDLWSWCNGTDLCGPRNVNRYAELHYHDSNIPCITFEECSLPGLRNEYPRLVSTDIGGTVVIWNVESCKPALVLKSHHDISDHDPLRAGWGVLSLDPRSFTRAVSLTAALGVSEVASADQVHLVDISHSRQLISNNKRWNMPEERRARAAAIATPASVSAPTSDNDENEQTNNDDSLLDDTLPSDAALRALYAYKLNLKGNIATMYYNNITADDCDETGQFPLFFSKVKKSMYFGGDDQKPSLSTSSGPLLLCNPQSIHLFQSLSLHRRSRDDPVIYMSDPLEQHCRPDLAMQLAQLDRLNLTAQIPELGVVLVGSAKGRVAVLTLHRLDEAVYSFSSSVLDARPHTFTMRLLTILPLHEQEEQDQRPLQPLVGLAVSPIQGHQRKTGRRTWRVMLTYRDHTVLSYEIFAKNTLTTALA